MQHNDNLKLTLNGSCRSAGLEKCAFRKCGMGQNRDVSCENIVGIISVLSTIYMTPCYCAALNFAEIMTDIMLKQQIQTLHPREFP